MPVSSARPPSPDPSADSLLDSQVLALAGVLSSLLLTILMACGDGTDIHGFPLAKPPSPASLSLLAGDTAQSACRNDSPHLHAKPGSVVKVALP